MMARSEALQVATLHAAVTVCRTSLRHGRSRRSWRRVAGQMHAIHNARIQLFATALNNLGVGTILAGMIVPSVNGTVGDWLQLGLSSALTW
jgi:hypothetical protein